MAAEDSSGPRPPVVLRIKLRYENLDAMVHRFAPNVGKSGLFLPTKSVQPLGAEIKFELRLADDTPVLIGLGRVKAVREPDPTNPKAAFGMAIELMRVTRESRDLILRMLERRRSMGLAEVPIPMPADIEAARRSEVVDTQIRDISSGPVHGPMAPIDSGQVGLLTSPRRPTGPIAIARMTPAVTPLAPEEPRRKRMVLSEIIESASGAVSAVQVSVPGLDDDIDIGAVLARARMLAGGIMDAELQALLDVAAAPLEITIEAASAELARQLGGAAVSRRDRSARWAPPPSISTPIAVVPVSEPAIGPALEQALESPAPEAPARAPDPAFEPSFTGAATYVDELESSPVHLMIAEPEDDANEVEPDQIADEIHQLSEDDFEEVEHTQLGGSPIDPAAFDQQAHVTEPGVGEEELAQRLDAHLAQAEAEAEADDLGMSTADRPLEDASEPIVEGLNSADLASYGEPAPEPAVPPNEVDIEPEEIDDFEILAEADAEDADLLSSHAEQDEVSRPSHSDFASRLDLGDESYTPAPNSPPSGFSGVPARLSERDQQRRELDPRLASAGQALAAFGSQFDEPASYNPDPQDAFDVDSGYTLAADLPSPSIEFDVGHTGFSMPREFDNSDIIDPERLPASRPRTSGPPPAEDPYDLETALEALDVNLDELSVPHQPVAVADRGASTGGVRQSGSARVNPRFPRATSDDGVEIEFDDDDR